MLSSITIKITYINVLKNYPTQFATSLTPNRELLIIKIEVFCSVTIFISH